MSARGYARHSVYPKLSFFQLVAEAVYSGVTIQTATATIDITVTRNQNAPRYLNNNNNFAKTISENFPLGDLVENITATDADGVSCALTWHRFCFTVSFSFIGIYNFVNTSFTIEPIQTLQREFKKFGKTQENIIVEEEI